MPRGNSIPTVTSPIPRDLRMYLDRTRELLLNIQSADDLIAVKKTLGEIGVLNEKGEVLATQVDLQANIPTAPTNLTATGAFDNIILAWDSTTYLGHGYTEIWATGIYDNLAPPSNLTPYETLDNATQVGVTSGEVFSDYVGNGKARNYWIRHVNIKDRAGAFNSVVATNAATSLDVDYLLENVFEPTSVDYTVNIVDISNPQNLPPSPTDGQILYDTLQRKYYYYSTAEQQWKTLVDPTVPFSVQTTPTTINGVAVPPGVYIKDAFIGNGSISNAKIGNAAIDNAKIADAAISNAKIGNIIQSTALAADGNPNWKIDKTGGIDARNITIRDTDGNIMLASGGTLSASLISGLGAFATLSQITPSNVSTYIASAAIGSAYIEDASIISAKIDTAAVDTLKLAGQAVTIPSSAYTSADYSIAQSSTSWYTVQSLTYTSTGAPTQINFVCGLDVGLSFGSGIEVEFALFRGTTLLEEFVGSGGEAEIKTCVSIAYLDTNTTVGARTYYVKARRLSGISSVASKRSLTTLEVKR